MTFDLQSLTAFSVRADYGRDHTTFLVTPAGSAEPIVRMHKDYPHDVFVRPFYVHPVAEPQLLLGYVKMGKAWDAQQVEIGTVGKMAPERGMQQGPIVQHGLGTLQPERQALTGKQRVVRGALGLIDDLVWSSFRGDQSQDDQMFSAHIRCAGPTSAGFELVRRAGVTATYDVAVHDPNVSRLLVLAFVERFNDTSDGDPRQSLITLATNPFRNRNKAENRRMQEEKRRREGL
ncbi:hypothetical protein DN069_11650 [Streptacidiphilus pinicola]|uniref:Uncharacterized protein n=1 Tax=Streptacidiphilus pinicola TaxID=2219663 RepID=A0A2X0K810_9ACTN|nr:hypothetical protein [Streptacidiphilus pinicola]RAG85425.1 hypothetical protein DN069_11650 [Streptacidiphilus pinicola]